VLAPLAAYVPLASLAGLLAVVCWNMVEHREVRRLFARWPEASVFACTLGLTIFRDLSAGVVGGCLLAFALHGLGYKLARETESA
jgi:SulP family sulfate permease